MAYNFLCIYAGDSWQLECESSVRPLSDQREKTVHEVTSKQCKISQLPVCSMAMDAIRYCPSSICQSPLICVPAAYCHAIYDAQTIFKLAELGCLWSGPVRNVQSPNQLTVIFGYCAKPMGFLGRVELLLNDFDGGYGLMSGIATDTGVQQPMPSCWMGCPRLREGTEWVQPLPRRSSASSQRQTLIRLLMS